MPNEDLVLPHDPNTGFLRGNQAVALPVAQTLAQVEALNRNIQGLVDLIQRNAPNAASGTPNPSPQPANSPAIPANQPIARLIRPVVLRSNRSWSVQPIARVTRPNDSANPNTPASTPPIQRPTRDMNGRMMGASASGEDSNVSSSLNSGSRDDAEPNKGFFENFLEQFQERFEQATGNLSVPDQIDPAVGAFREMTAPLRLLGSMGGSPADKQQFALGQRTLKFLGAWRKESKTQQDETQDAIRGSQNRQSKSSLMNGLKVAAMTPRLLALLAAAAKAAAVAAAAKAGKEIGEKANEVLASTETGQKILDSIGEAGTHVAAAFGNKQAIDVIAENLRVEQEQLAQGAATGKPTTTTPATDNTQAAQNGGGTSGNGLFKRLADAIGFGEGNYNSVHRGVVRNKDLGSTEADLSNMTINEVLARNKLPAGDKNRMNAVGKYQIIASTMKGLKTSMRLTGDEKLTPEMQDRLFMGLLPTSVTDYVSGKSNNKNAALTALAKVYASIGVPEDMRGDIQDIKAGESFYKGIGQNKANPKSLRLVTEALEGIRTQQMAAPPITTPAIQNRIENFKPMRMAEDTIQPAPKLHMPKEAAELAKHAESLDRPAPNTPQQQSRSDQGQSSENWYDQYLFKGVGQSVEDRLIAHAVTGGLGWKT